MSVHLVGAGPGDEGLITVRGLDLLEVADVIIYDYLVNKNLLARAKPGAKLIFVGKQGGLHSKSQSEINQILIQEAETAEKKGQIVVRLKGGDPFLFGRGGEEVEALQAAKLKFEIVPGVTSALAVPAYAGIPLTHRDFSSSVTIVSGHNATGNAEPDWQALGKGSDTLVILMGMRNLDEITRNIIAGGLSLDTPATVVEWGSLGRQRKVVASLYDIAIKVKEFGLAAPAVLVVGRVAEFARELSWFEEKPLFGRTIIVTRARAQVSEFSSLLKSMGANIIEFPVIKICSLPDPGPIIETIKNLNAYSWLVFTSVNGVNEFFRVLSRMGLDCRTLAGNKIAAIGSSTSKAMQAYGVLADYMPDTYIGESLAEGLSKRVSEEAKPILIIRAKATRQALEKCLHEKGISSKILPIYETVLPEKDSLFNQAQEEVLAALQANFVDAVIFCSSSAVDNFFKLIEPGKFQQKSVALACIGPITAESLKKHDLVCTVQSEVFNLTGLADALSVFFNAEANKEK